MSQRDFEAVLIGGEQSIEAVLEQAIEPTMLFRFSFEQDGRTASA
jgi:hypothetical protein